MSFPLGINCKNTKGNYRKIEKESLSLNKEGKLRKLIQWQEI
jgi:hypothetical protein